MHIKKPITMLIPSALIVVVFVLAPSLGAEGDNAATPPNSDEKATPEAWAAWKTDIVAYDKYLGKLVASWRVPGKDALERRITLKDEAVARNTEVMPLGGAAGRSGFVDLKPAKDTVQFRVNEALKGQSVKWELEMEGGVVVPGSHMTLESKQPLLQLLTLEAPWQEPKDPIVTGERVVLEGTIGDFASNKGTRGPLTGPVAIYHRANAPPTVFQIGLKEATITRVDPDTSSKLHEPDARRQAAVAWREFSPAKLKQLRSKNKPVLVFCRADWDLTCEALDCTLFTDRRVIDAIKQRGYIPFRADCTSPPDEMLKSFLRDVGWNGEATIVVFRGPNHDDPVVLQVGRTRRFISTDELLDAIKP